VAVSFIRIGTYLILEIINFFLGSKTDMEAIEEILNTPEEVKWDHNNGAVIKFTQ
jgi:hypothetical protein|tara:strand:+ start:800 stop:964 length:165 start_codon:yes stop_codon:yes gene_type:complete